MKLKRMSIWLSLQGQDSFTFIISGKQTYSRYFQTHNISFINNKNIIKNGMYSDGLHLLRSRKRLLSNICY